MSINLIRDRIPWHEAWELTSELLKDPYSRIAAAIQGWTRAPDPVEVALITWINVWAQSKKQPGKIAPPIITGPWEQPDTAPQPDDGPPVDHEANRRLLEERFHLT